MAWNDQVSSDMAHVYDTDFDGVSAVHTNAASTETACIVTINLGTEDPDEGADAFGVTAELRVQVSEVTTVAVRDTFTIGSDVWEVIFADYASDGLEWICEVSKQ